MTPTLSEAHPELFHYTTFRGMEGILRTQTLWATHFQFLNDSMEFETFKEKLLDVLKSVFEKFIADKRNKNQLHEEEILKQGGLEVFLNKLTSELANSMYGSLLGTVEVEPFIEPYITSFCTTDKKLIAEHGLLSQWRGYGKEGGYALVFDTGEVDELLKDEANKWTYNAIFGGDAVYSDDEGSFEQELGEHVAAIKSGIIEFLNDPADPRPLEKTYYPLVYCTCRYKHWGFHEEKEVRIIATPLTKALREGHRARNEPIRDKPRSTFKRGGNSVPCIHLFEGITQHPNKLLPIKRIIVGPHTDKEKRKIALDKLLENLNLNIPVSISQIPYIGRS